MSIFSLWFHPKFVVGLETAIGYYDERSKKIGDKFAAGVRKQLKLIKKNPYTRSVRYDNIRFARIEKFPYAIHYSIDVDNNVVVHRILCDHQDAEQNG